MRTGIITGVCSVNRKEAFESGYVIIPNREALKDGFGLLCKWQWLYPDGTHHRELPKERIKVLEKL